MPKITDLLFCNVKTGLISGLCSVSVSCLLWCEIVLRSLVNSARAVFPCRILRSI